MILYEGKSAIDGKTDIVVIATGIKTRTRNEKTGDMIQTWILIKDEYPMEAINNGNDYAICGNCPHRKYDGKRSCYVMPMSFCSVYKKYQAGGYERFNEAEHSDLFRGRKIRYGSYGDPVNIPETLINTLNKYVDGHTGYTHQWHDNRFSSYRQYFMASVDSLSEFFDAQDQGWSTFRVKKVSDSSRESSEVNCQGGVKTTCKLCTLCDGASERQRHVAINAHGRGAKYI